MKNIFDYTCKQLSYMFPMLEDTDAAENDFIMRFSDDTLKRYEICVKENKIFKGDLQPDPYHVMKYPIFLYLLSRSIYESGERDSYRIKDRLHALNKALHGCSIYYTTKLQSAFFLNYATGIVLAPANYGNKLVLYHGVSVTENNSTLPTIGNYVTVMPGALISGKTVIGNYVTISAGTKVIDKIIEDNSVVFQGADNELVIKQAKKNYSTKYFSC